MCISSCHSAPAGVVWTHEPLTCWPVGSGIAAGSPILVNYGPDFDLGYKFVSEEESSYGGALDVFFRKLDSASPGPLAPAGLQPAAAEMATPVKRPAVPDSTPSDPKRARVGSGPEGQKLAETKQPETKQTEAAVETQQAAAKHVETKQTETKQPETTQPAPSRPAGATSGPRDVGEVPPFKVVMRDGTLHVLNSDTKPRRVNKGTVIRRFTQGNVVRGVEVPLNGIEYTLQPSSWVLHETHGYVQIKDLVKKVPGCTSVFGYTPFPANTPPTKFEPLKAGKLILQADAFATGPDRL